MPIEQHDTFQELSDAEFKNYAESLLDSFSSSQKRKEVVAFLQNVQSDDKTSLLQKEAHSEPNYETERGNKEYSTI